MKITPTSRVVAALGLAVFVAACSPRDLETAPVTIDTAQGPVVCQLYTDEVVYWDRSINRPENTDVTTADNLCRAEGKRRFDAMRRN